jgi:hypothetical protein
MQRPLKKFPHWEGERPREPERNLREQKPTCPERALHVHVCRLVYVNPISIFNRQHWQTTGTHDDRTKANALS